MEDIEELEMRAEEAGDDAHMAAPDDRKKLNG